MSELTILAEQYYQLRQMPDAPILLSAQDCASDLAAARGCQKSDPALEARYGDAIDMLDEAGIVEPITLMDSDNPRF